MLACSGASFGWCLAGWFMEWLCEIGITYLAALRSYTLSGLSVQIVKFSFLLTFSAEIVFINKIITIAPLLYCSTSNSYLTLVNSPTVVLWSGRCIWRGLCSSNDVSVLYAINTQRPRSNTAKVH